VSPEGPKSEVRKAKRGGVLGSLPPHQLVSKLPE